MSGPRRPTLCKPEHASRAREFCARGVTSPDLAGRFGVPATRRLIGSASFGGDSKTTGGKGGKGGNLQSLGNSGLFDDGATWRKPAETGGNPLQKLCSRNCPHFPCLTFGLHYIPPIGHSLAEIAGIAGVGRLPANPKQWMQASGDQRFIHQSYFCPLLQDLSLSRAIILRGGTRCHRTVTPS